MNVERASSPQNIPRPKSRNSPDDPLCDIEGSSTGSTFSEFGDHILLKRADTSELTTRFINNPPSPATGIPREEAFKAIARLGHASEPLSEADLQGLFDGAQGQHRFENALEMGSHIKQELNILNDEKSQAAYMRNLFTAFRFAHEEQRGILFTALTTIKRTPSLQAELALFKPNDVSKEVGLLSANRGLGIMRHHAYSLFCPLNFSTKPVERDRRVQDLYAHCTRNGISETVEAGSPPL